MANSKVTYLPWSELRQRRETPPHVVDAIPIEDLRRFVCLMATRPVDDFADAQVVKARLRKVRQRRMDMANVATET